MFLSLVRSGPASNVVAFQARVLNVCGKVGRDDKDSCKACDDEHLNVLPVQVVGSVVVEGWL